MSLPWSLSRALPLLALPSRPSPLRPLPSARRPTAPARPPSPRGHRGRVRAPLPLALAFAVVGALTAGCGEHEYERLGRELAERLTAEGYAVEEGLVWPPRGTVPHWVIELTIPGGEANAEALCAHVEDTVTYDGEAPYLVRVAYQPAGVVECGWGKAEIDGGSSTPSGSPSG